MAAVTPVGEKRVFSVAPRSRSHLFLEVNFSFSSRDSRQAKQKSYFYVV